MKSYILFCQVRRCTTPSMRAATGRSSASTAPAQSFPATDGTITMFEENAGLRRQVVNWYSMYINRFLFETIHQEFNSSLVKLCNLLYLLTVNQPANSGLVIEMTQEELADILGLSRVQITRELTALRRRGIISTTRGKLTVSDLPALVRLCTDETV